MTLPQLANLRSQEPSPAAPFSPTLQGLRVGASLANETIQYTSGSTWRVSDLLQVRRVMRVAGSREVELQWRRANREVLRRYVGQWLVLDGQRIVAFDPSAAEAIKRAREGGIDVPYVFRVEAPDEDAATFGL